MTGSRIWGSFKWAVTIAAIALNAFVYFYPDILNAPGQCNWHNPAPLTSKHSYLNKIPSPWREYVLLNFPSLRTAKEEEPYCELRDIKLLAFGDPQINGNWALTKYIKRLDNYGNDYYLGHIYKTMKNRLEPDYVAVMGDLFSSQWILDSEFYNRTYRFVDRLFTRLPEYKQNVLETHAKHEDYDWMGFHDREKAMDPVERFNSRVNNDVYDWFNYSAKPPAIKEPLFINLTGNHDIGYSGDATWQHMARFHLLFGQNNYVINYNKGLPQEWRLVVMDSLTLEGPALQPEFLEYTWSFLENLRDRENPTFKGSTVLLTHIPFYKKEGICMDGPEHIYYDETYTRETYKNGNLRSQNHLSYETTQKALNIIFPNEDKPGISLTGHDHEGCDSYYNFEGDQWVASKTPNASQRAPVREIVVRSMMGDFDGQTGILTGQFDTNSSKWVFNFSYCSFVVQHWWWASKVTAAVSLLLHSISFISR